MSVAYYVIVNDDVDFDTYVSGKVLGQLADKLNSFCVSNKLKPLDFYLHQDFSEFLSEDLSDGLVDDLNHDMETLEQDLETTLDDAHKYSFDKNQAFLSATIDEQDPLENDEVTSDAPEQDEVWFDPEQGMKWVDDVVSALQNQSPDFLTTDLIAELLEYQEVFRKTQKAGLLWHLEMDY